MIFAFAELENKPRGREELEKKIKMKDLAESVELGVTQRKGTRPRVWFKREFVRVGLAETLCTYVMMVRDAALCVLSNTAQQ